MRHFCPDIPYVLVGCKKDLRHDQSTLAELKKMNQTPVTQEQAEAIASRINAYAYIECSAKTKVGCGGWYCFVFV